MVWFPSLLAALVEVVSGSLTAYLQIDRMAVFKSDTRKYVKCRFIAAGTSALVIEAAPLDFDSDVNECVAGLERVALKCSKFASEPGKSRLIDEYRLVQSLSGLEWNLDAIDHFVDSDVECMVLQLGGDSLVVYSGRDITLSDRIATAIRMIDIVDDLHNRNITHRDLNMANWLVDRTTGQVNVIDFEIASDAEDRFWVEVDYTRLASTIASLLRADCGADAASHDLFNSIEMTNWRNLAALRAAILSIDTH